MIIYLVGADSKMMKYRKRYKHVLFTFGDMREKTLNKMIKRKKGKTKWLLKKEQS